MSDGLGKVSDGLENVSDGLGNVSDGLRKVRDSLGKVKVYHGVRKVYHGERKVYHGVRKVYCGVRKVWTGRVWTGRSRGTWKISSGERDIQTTNIQTKPRRQPPKYRAIQISFDGLGSQGKYGDWQFNTFEYTVGKFILFLHKSIVYR